MSVIEVLTGSSGDGTLPSVYELLQRPAWHTQAACRGQGPDAWFPPQYERPPAEIIELCAACPVRHECADAGLGERFGWWGGLSPRDRVRRTSSRGTAA